MRHQRDLTLPDCLSLKEKCLATPLLKSTTIFWRLLQSPHVKRFTRSKQFDCDVAHSHQHFNSIFHVFLDFVTHWTMKLLRTRDTASSNQTFLSMSVNKSSRRKVDNVRSAL